MASRTLPFVPAWRQNLMAPQRARYINNVGNAVIWLTNEPAVKDMLTFDEMSGLAMLMHPVPWMNGEVFLPDVAYPHPLEDHNVTEIQAYLQVCGFHKLGRQTAWDAVLQRARDCPVHPVKNYLEAVEWDGKERAPFWLHDYLDVEESAYSSAVGKMFLIAMVARILDPGCKADYMLVLEGPQGILKSQACSILGGEWFSSSLPDIINTKDAMHHLYGKWLIELSEMHAIGRAESNLLKSFLSRETDRFRPAYGRNEVVHPRQCLFIGTTNESHYLRDHTGNRRFWPVKCGSPDISALRRDRDQLFAEAVVRFRGKERHWPDPTFETEFIKPEQEQRRDADAWEPKITEWLEGTLLPKVQIVHVARDALGLETSRLNTADQRRVTSAMMLAGWRRAGRDNKGQWWERE